MDATITQFCEYLDCQPAAEVDGTTVEGVASFVELCDCPEQDSTTDTTDAADRTTDLATGFDETLELEPAGRREHPVGAERARPTADRPLPRSL